LQNKKIWLQFDLVRLFFYSDFYILVFLSGKMSNVNTTIVGVEQYRQASDNSWKQEVVKKASMSIIDAFNKTLIKAGDELKIDVNEKENEFSALQQKVETCFKMWLDINNIIWNLQNIRNIEWITDTLDTKIKQTEQTNKLEEVEKKAKDFDKIKEESDNTKILARSVLNENKKIIDWTLIWRFVTRKTRKEIRIFKDIWSKYWIFDKDFNVKLTWWSDDIGKMNAFYVHLHKKYWFIAKVW